MADALQATQKWVWDVVVGHNFCPFAKKEVLNQSIYYHVSPATQIDQALQVLLDEIQRLEQHPEIETSILIYQQGFAEFDNYLELLDMANLLLAQSGYDGIFQLASFHPDYCFEGEDEADAANYTNRAPYPCLHLLREEGMSRATSKYPDPEGIPQRNIDYARQLGTEKLMQQLADCKSSN